MLGFCFQVFLNYGIWLFNIPNKNPSLWLNPGIGIIILGHRKPSNGNTLGYTWENIFPWMGLVLFSQIGKPNDIPYKPLKFPILYPVWESWKFSCDIWIRASWISLQCNYKLNYEQVNSSRFIYWMSLKEMEWFIWSRLYCGASDLLKSFGLQWDSNL